MESKTDTTEITTKAHLQSCGLGVSITRHAWTKLMAYCRSTELETSGFFLYERDGDLLWIEEVYILPQESTGTSTEIDRTDITKFQLELQRAGVIGQRNSKKRLGHWHTHPTFGVFWSGTDMEMRRLNRQGVEFFLSIVVNQKGEALCAIDINGDFPLSINDLPIEIVDNQDVAELIKACKAEVELKVKRPSSSWGGGDGHVGYYAPGGQGYRSSARKYWNPETSQWEEDNEQLVLNADTPPAEVRRNHGNAKSCYCGAQKPKYINWEGCSECFKKTGTSGLLGPGDRRARKAQKRYEKLKRKVANRQGTVSYEQWKADQAELDAARLAVQLASAAPAKVIAAAEEGDITIVEGSQEDIVMSDEEGTYQNIAGEIVRTDDPAVMWD